MAAEKKYIVAAMGAGQHEQGAIITKADCGPDGAWCDRWVEVGAIREATSDEVKAASKEPDARSAELATGDDKMAETAVREEAAKAEEAAAAGKVETPTDRAAAKK